MSAPIRVVLFGVGVIGSGVLRLARTRREVEIAGAVVRDPRWEGRPLEEIVPDGPTGLRLSTDGARVLSETQPDVVVIATRSTLPEIVPTLRLAAKARAAIACTAEELAYIRPDDGPEAAEIFDLAEENHVPIVAVGSTRASSSMSGRWPWLRSRTTSHPSKPNARWTYLVSDRKSEYRSVSATRPTSSSASLRGGRSRGIADSARACD